ncbi:hypothetical protein IC762_17645 [Bradyrhizobium genosp. L]|uniref:hypothetical protein n=1 Tax=Bradyrhizobium genosp. L TaxID=83637 RepID=UPI0018A2B10B|nr:hypothetical protein [Bradyrhizobium genosp. L]QPF81650.1 hypothetical protein IC762_17645 [Bradyrhizobium genosp. L]
MISPDAKVTTHVPPRKRIDLSPRRGGDPNADIAADMAYSPTECDRIWALVKQAAGSEVTPVDLARLCAPL